MRIAIPKCVALTALLLLCGLAPSARADVAVLRPLPASPAPTEADLLAQATTEVGLADANVQTISAADAKTRLMAAAAKPCLDVDCAGSMLRAIGADMLVATVVGKAGSTVIDVLVQLVDVEGRYVHATTNVENGDVATATRASLNQALSKWPARGLVPLRVEGTPLGATVLLDGQPKGTLPVDIRVQPGSHTLTVSMQGYRDTTRKVVASTTPGPGLTEQVNLEPDSGTNATHTTMWKNHLLGGSLVAAGLVIGATPPLRNLTVIGDCIDAACERKYQWDNRNFGYIAAGLAVIGVGSWVAWRVYPFTSSVTVDRKSAEIAVRSSF